MKRLLQTTALCAGLSAVLSAQADVTISVSPSAPWIGWMNVFNLPSAGGAFQFGSGWGVADLNSSWAGPVLTLSPNTIGDPDPYWYTPSGGPGSTGNKIMDANLYVEQTGSLSGQNVTFTGTVLANTLVAPYTSVAFIKDFAPNYSSFNMITVPLTAGNFSLTLATVNDAGRHVQYGFETIGPNVWVTDVGPMGSVQITAVPEPSAVAVLAAGLTALFALRGRRAA